MRIKEVSTSCSVRVNTGNYEGTEFYTRAVAEVDELDDAEEALADLTAVTERAMVTQLTRSYKVRGKTAMTDPTKVAKHHGLTHVPAKVKGVT